VPEPGFAVEFNVDPQGSELDQAATATDTVLYVGDASDYDAPGTLRVDTGAALVDVDFTASDTDADTVTLAVPLGVAAEVGDRVYILSGGDIAYDHTLEVHTADGDPVDIDVDYADRVLWEPGPIDPPVPVLLSDDLTTVVDVPGRRALVNPFAVVAPLFIGYLAANQSIPNNASTTVTSWVVRTLAGGMEYDPATATVVVGLDGWYSVIHSAVTWDPNATGRRTVQPRFNTVDSGVVQGGLYNADASADLV